MPRASGARRSDENDPQETSLHCSKLNPRALFQHLIGARAAWPKAGPTACQVSRRSTSSTVKPCWRSAAAVVRPARPPPTTRIVSIFAMFTPLAVNVSENAPIDVSLGVPTIFDFGAGGTAIWTGVNSCGNIREGDHPDASDARGDARARPMRHLQVFDRRPTQAGACPSCARPPPARAHHAAGRARADRAARAVG